MLFLFFFMERNNIYTTLCMEIRNQLVGLYFNSLFNLFMGRKQPTFFEEIIVNVL